MSDSQMAYDIQHFGVNKIVLLVSGEILIIDERTDHAVRIAPDIAQKLYEMMDQKLANWRRP
jgi:hypothetical protein